MFKGINNKTIFTFLSIVFTAVLMVPVSGGFAQEGTDIFLIKTKKNIFGFSIYPETIKKISEGKQYDNQPTFINENQFVFTSEDPSGNFDIIMHNLKNGKFTNMTRTPDISEFSPALTSCGQYISAVIVEKDSTQRLWLYPINFGEPELLYDDIQPVGYYGWNEETAALFLIETPNKLVYPYSRDDIFEIAQNPGRCIKKRPGSNEIAYINKNVNIVKDGKDTYELIVFDVDSRESKNIGLALPEAEDFIWLDKNNLLMGRENSIYIRNIRKGTDWEKIATLQSSYKNISRMAISPDRKNLVVTMEK